MAGCAPKRLDPPTFRESSAPAAQLAATLQARSAGGLAFHVLDTHSMEPLLFGGDWIVVAPRPYAELQLGQVVTYRADWLPADSPPVTHRLAQKDGLGWILSGDNNPRSEPHWRVTENNFLGLVVGIWTARK